MSNWRRLSRKDGGTIWVNLDRATVIGEAPDNAGALIQFGDVGGDEFVTESADEIAQLARGAPNA